MRRGGTLAALTVALAMVASITPAAAHDPSEQRQREIRTEIERLEDELDEAAAAEAELLAELRVSRRDQAVLDAQVAALDGQVRSVRTELRSAESALEQALSRHQVALRRLQDARSTLRQARRDLQDQAIAAFTRGGRGAGDLDVLLRVRDVRELHEARTYMAVVAHRQAAVVDRYRALEDDIEHLADDLEVAAEQARGRRDEVEARTAELEAARRQEDAARDRVAAEVAHQEHLVDELEARQSDYERRLATLRRESEEIAALIRRRQAGQDISRCSGGRLAPPLRSARVTSRYGWRTHPIFGTSRLHTGVDFGASHGTPILAAAGGTVIYAGWRGGYGNAVVVDHGGSLATLYAHQSRLAVRSGQQVAQGQVVGAVGSTGFSTGPHLHFEVRVNGTPVDPLGCL